MAVKVLVVDDDLNIQRVLSFTLKQEGFDVMLAGDGESGVALVAEQAPDLILMDAVLPGMDGYQAITRIRGAEAAGQRVPILLLTTEADVVQRVKGLRAGADDDIVKPFHPAELMARIRALLARSGLGGPRAGSVQATLRRVIVFYGAKGGVGNTTMAINTAIALAAEHKRRVALVDANLQFGDLRVFLDLKLDTASIVNAISEPELDADLLRRLVVSHSSGIDLLLAPDRPRAGRRRDGEPPRVAGRAVPPRRPACAVCTTTPSSTPRAAWTTSRSTCSTRRTSCTWSSPPTCRA